MDFISKLPAELSTQVLSYLNVFELAKFERVSKSWHSIIRTNSTLWKDDKFDGQEVEIRSIQHQKKYKAMLKRSGGKLDKIFLPLCLAYLTQKEIVSLLSFLPKSDVKDLWIVIKKRPTCPNQNIIPGARISNIQFRDAVEAVLKAVVHCDQLKSLRLVSTENVLVNMKSFGDPAKWPFCANRLKKLALHRINYDALFPCEVVHQAITEAEDIEMNHPIIPINFASKDILRFLSAAKATLKRCYASHAPGSLSWVVTMPDTFIFPQLERLYLTIFDKVIMRRPGESQVVSHIVECPNLKVLHVPLGLPPQMMESVLCENIEELCFYHLPYKTEHIHVRRRILEKLEKCTKLKKLIFSGTRYIADIKDLRVLLCRAPLEEIRMEFVPPEVVRAVKHMVKDRLSDETLAKIQKITFLTDVYDTKEEAAWFKKHVPEVVLYDPNNPALLEEKLEMGCTLLSFE